MKYNQKAKHDLLQLMTTTQHLPYTGDCLSHHAYSGRGLYVSGTLCHVSEGTIAWSK